MIKKRIQLTCQQCNKLFKVRPSSANRKFCNMQCKAIDYGSKHKGIKSNLWKGGIAKHQRGYVLIRCSNHPYGDKRGYVFEHRLVIEKQIGRFLNKEEASHHINKILTDNRPENLMAFVNHSAHRKFECKKTTIHPSEIIFDGRHIGGDKSVLKPI